MRQKYQYVQQLNKEGQLDVAEFWLKQLRVLAPKFGLVFFDDESLLSGLDMTFKSIGLSFEEEIASRKKAGERIRFAGKRKLQEVITEKFKRAFGNQCIDHDYDDICDPSSRFDMKCCGWLLSTHFWFGRSESLINYSHSIVSPTKTDQKEDLETSTPAFGMASGISFGSWLGITNQITWEYLFKEEVDAACDAVMKQCHHFFEIAPKLLKGLEFETITAS